MSLIDPTVSQAIAEWQLYPEVFNREVMGWTGPAPIPSATDQQLELFKAVGEMARAKLAYLDVCEGRMDKTELSDKDWSLIRKWGISVMSGKGCHAAGTEILMWDGTIKRVEEIEVGDTLIGDDSTPRIVTSLVRGDGEKFYRISYRNGEHYDVNENHVLSLQCGGKKGKDELGDIADVTIPEFLCWNKTKRNRFFLYRASVKHWESTLFPIPPYILGIWLGDGSVHKSEITNVDREVLDALGDYATSIGLWLSRYDDRHTRITKGSFDQREHKFLSAIRSLGLDKNKHIPRQYLIASEKDRLDLLAGLLDTDGCADIKKHGSAQYEFIQKRKNLAEQTRFLARSLGFHCTMKEVQKSWSWKGEKKFGTYYLLNISRGDVSRIPCRVARRKVPKTNCKALRFQFTIEELPPQPFYGFSLTGNGRFLGADFTVLHNTGKGGTASSLISWFLWCFERCKSPITGPSFDQVRRGLMAETHKWLTFKDPKTGLPICAIHDQVEVQSDTIFLKMSGPKSRFFAVRTAPPEANEAQQKGVLDGWHEDAMMIVVDEAASVADGVFSSFTTTLTKPFNFAVLFFNPTRSRGFAYETHFGKYRDSFVQLHWDSRKTPLVTEAQLAEMERAYGKDGPEYRINVLGLPPVDDPTALIPRSWIEAAVDRWQADCDKTWEGFPAVAGFDPGGGGTDESAYVVRRGKRVSRVEGKSEADASKLADWLFMQMLADEVDILYIDSVGIGGPTMDFMRRDAAKWGFNPQDIRAADVRKSSTDRKYRRMRDQAWWMLRKWLQDDMAQVPDDAKLKNELGSIKQVPPDKDGKTIVESKEQMKARKMPSPNRADALMMTMFANDEALMMQKRAETDPWDAEDEAPRSKLTWMGR